MFFPSKDATRHSLSRPETYVVYGWQQSYFTHKLMAALTFYDADWRYADKTKANAEELRLRSNTHQVPVLHTPEDWVIADTTPLLRMLDHRFPDRRMFPGGLMGLKTHVIEEYFDEWIARTTVHWRWNYEENHELLSMSAAHGDAAIAQQLIVWGGKVCRALGIDSEIQKQAAEAEYHRIMEQAEAQLSETPYLLGTAPTAVDCIVLAGLRAHFLYDSAPDGALRPHYPRVVAWAERGADDWDGTGSVALTPFGDFILSEMRKTYMPFAQGNRAALSAGERFFIIPIYGEDVSYLARPYIEQSRQMVANHAASLGPDAQDWLASVGLEAVFGA
ncbi:MAG: glutathione S-transferase family protein [Pseudomonadota bacterium]